MAARHAGPFHRPVSAGENLNRRLLVLGGARSGKSRLAESLAAPYEDRLYIATAEPGDEEMRNRIADHKTRRGDRWQTIEEPLHLLEAIVSQAREGRFILVDCLTLWINNLLHRQRVIHSEVEALASRIPSLPGHLVFVSNEVGLGIVPDNQLARLFRDEAGFANQRFAAACDEVLFVAAGLALKLKG